MFCRIAVGAVTGGEGMKGLIMEYLQKQGICCGAADEAFSVSGSSGADEAFDPGSGVQTAAFVAREVADGRADGGIVIDACGLDSSITANKFKGIRASRCTSITTARYTRRHNDSNILCIGHRTMGRELALRVVQAWISAEFEGGRHAISVNLIREGEQNQFKDGKPASGAKVSDVLQKTEWPAKRIYIACDHAGFETKGFIIRMLRERNVECIDMGTDSTGIVRYPYYAARVAGNVKISPGYGGILVCGTGIGMSISADKFKGIRAALCSDVFSARYARECLDSNILCVGGKIIGQFELEELIHTWLDTKFMGDAGEEAEGDLASLRRIEEINLQETDWKPASNI